MKTISLGKLRGLQQISSDRDAFTTLALDPSQNLRKENPAFISDEELSRLKLDVTSALAVGRAVWKEAVTMDSAERMNFLRATAHQRLSRLTSLCYALAKPYTDFYQANVPFDWSRSYRA
jgi:tagatose-1,6-bisphosphate aldolase